MLRPLALLFGCVACHAAVDVAPPAASLPKIAAAPPVAPAPAPMPIAPTESVVVSGATYGMLALWRVSSTGKFEPFAFLWAELSIIDSLHVSPDGREVAYVEGGTSFARCDDARTFAHA